MIGRSYMNERIHYITFHYIWDGGHCGHDRMVVGLQLPVESVPITTKVVSSNPVHGEYGV
jgi:hypothetical protein